MKKIFFCDDGYTFEQLPDGTWTDGDVTFEMHNVDLDGIELEVFNDDGKTVYCADGDGFVTLECIDGQSAIFDQGEQVATLSCDLTRALATMLQYLAATYPAIYSNFHISA